jgi:alanyl-tRNA synthetase
VQKCVRTLDIDEVGKTTRHGTFFQMNGNFSFGDYFKDKAIEYAWDLVTRSQSDGGLGFAERDLVVTVYHEDDEAIGLWKKIAGLSDDRIYRLGMGPNFWSMGVPGPCGPCSEIMVDRGSAFGPDREVEKAGDRYLEIWNLVFMQHERGEGTGKENFPILGDLPAKNIDTGMGLERVAYLLQGVDNLYEIDEVRPVLDRAAEIAGKRYGTNLDDDVRLRVVADHVRSALMLISDGVTPGNEAHRYVVRRLVRRAVRAMRLLGVDEPVLVELLETSKNRMALSYPELDSGFSRVAQIAAAEEDAFRRTLASGTAIFEVAARETVAAQKTELPAAQAFALHDTYGFPIDLTLEMAAEQGLSVDEVGFRALMKEQRERAKADAHAKRTGHGDVSGYHLLREEGPTRFTGYETLTTASAVRGILADGVRVPVAEPGSTVEVVLEETPFYAESGGQIADAGEIVGDGVRLEVLDVQRPVKGLIVHKVTVHDGELRERADVQATVDRDWRVAACQAHSGTHIVHASLRQVLGPNALQSGSYNKPGYLRLDFAWTNALSAATRSEVEEVANRAVRDDLGVSARYMPLPEAREIGALALFGETYGEEVRVVEIGGPWSRELCGGTHVQHSSQVGALTVLGESSIGSGVRRLEAYVGLDALHYLGRERALVAELTELLKVPSDGLRERVESLVGRLRDAEREIDRMRSATLSAQAGDLSAAATDVFGVAFVGHHAPDGTAADALRALALDVRARLGEERPSVVVVAAVVNDRPLVVATVNERGREWGLAAGDLVRVAASTLGGGGGGKPDIAQGGGKDPAALPAALTAVQDEVGRRVTAGH